MPSVWTVSSCLIWSKRNKHSNWFSVLCLEKEQGSVCSPDLFSGSELALEYYTILKRKKAIIFPCYNRVRFPALTRGW